MTGPLGETVLFPGVVNREAGPGLPCSASLEAAAQPPPQLTDYHRWGGIFGGASCCVPHAGPTLRLLGSRSGASPKVSSEMDPDNFFLNKSIMV